MKYAIINVVTTKIYNGKFQVAKINKTKHMKNKFIQVLFLGILVLTGCKKDLTVANNNQPDFQKVYASGEDLTNLTGGLFNTYYSGTHSYSGMQMFLATAADNVTCSWGNQAMRDMSWEPRKEWSNAPNYTYQGTTKYTFDKMYAVINTASNIIKAVDGGVKVGVNGADNSMIKAVCRFNMGIAYGVLALNFDRAFIVDEKTTIPGAKLSDAKPYGEIGTAAIGYLTQALSLAGNTFTVSKDWFGTPADLSNTQLKAMINSMIARILSNMPRNSTELAAVNWASVKTYADAGISSDFMVINDGYNKWYAEAGDYLTFPGWGLTDMYVVNQMDPQEPAHWDDLASFPAPPASTNPNADKRLASDFEYVPSVWLQATRGYYHWSNYRSKRYDGVYALGEGPLPEMLKAENDLYKAEARAYTGDLAGAAAIINAGTHTTRGGLPPVAADLNAIKAAIHAERHIELYVSGMGLQFYEMRKRNLLQKGTPLHLPLPAKTLETLAESLPFYTFGGVDKADGKNTSNAGWR